MFYLIASGACVAGGLSAFKALSATGTDAMNVVMGMAALLFSLALIGAAFYVRNNVIAKEIEKESGIVAGIAVYRSELERLIQLTYREWHVLLFFLPSYLTMLVGGLIVDQRPGKFMRYGLTIVAAIISICVTIWSGQKKRQCLQRDLDAIASLK
jgi:intracellular septation protein A